MKKGLVIALSIMMLAVPLGGCGEKNEIEKTVEEFVESVEKMDLDECIDYMDPDMVETLNGGIENIYAQQFGLDISFNDLVKNIDGNLDMVKNDIELNIDLGDMNVEVDGDRAVVTTSMDASIESEAYYIDKIEASAEGDFVLTKFDGKWYIKTYRFENFSVKQ